MKSLSCLNPLSLRFIGLLCSEQNELELSNITTTFGEPVSCQEVGSQDSRLSLPLVEGRPFQTWTGRWWHWYCRIHLCESHGVCVCVCVCVYVQSLNHVWLCATPWTVACQAPLCMQFSRQEYWSGLPFPTPVDLPHPGIDLCFLCLLHWQAIFFNTSATGEAWALWWVPSVYRAACGRGSGSAVQDSPSAVWAGWSVVASSCYCCSDWYLCWCHLSMVGVELWFLTVQPPSQTLWPSCRFKELPVIFIHHLSD